ncbi:MAG: hypothetical protein QOK43_2307 [Acidimicrobiaceae bacterium]|nr:hypothetical protein [Acidimicrobiaceae bacterium]
MRTRRIVGGAVVTALVALLLAAMPGQAAAPSTPNPIVTGPVQGGIRTGGPWQASLYPVEPHGYAEEEFFLEGTARTLSATLPVKEAPYKTRIIVRRPVSASRFNGIAVAEWVNVTGSYDLETLWPSDGELAMRAGYMWISVSAQLVGVCCGPGSLKVWDPVRYGSLSHPGDDFSFDIFSQAIQAVRHPERNRTSTLYGGTVVDPAGGLKVRDVIAHGASQSASRLTSYINGGYQDLSGVIDGFLITRGGGPYPNLKVPVLNLNEENNFSSAAQTDDNHFRFWQEAGISHAPAAWQDYVSKSTGRDLAGNSAGLNAVNAACSNNRGTSDYTHRAALIAISRWVVFDIAPPIAPRVQREGTAVARDDNGLALGGIRFPFIDAPVALNTSEGCPLFGTYAPWPVAKVKAMYPTQADYLAQVDASADRARAAGFLLPEDAVKAKADARGFDIWSTGGSCYDTANAYGDESGPVSGALKGVPSTLGPTTLGAATAVHEVSCNDVARAGL